MDNVKMYKLSNGFDVIGTLYEDQGGSLKISWPLRLFVSQNKEDPKLVDTSLLPLMPHMKDEFVNISKHSIMCESEINEEIVGNYLQSIELYKKQQEMKLKVENKTKEFLKKV